jgi:hypothetical protein
MIAATDVASSLDLIASRIRLAASYYERETALSVFRQLCEKNNLNAPLEGIERDVLLVNQFQCL